MATWTCPKARSEGVVVQELEGELLIYDLEEHEAHCLNSTAALVWKTSDGTRTPQEIAEALGEEDLEVVWVGLEELWRRGLLEGDAPAEREAGLSRRSLLRRAGVVLAIPVVASIAVPTASAAVSCAAIGEPCQTVQDCCPSNQVICFIGKCTID